MKGGLTGLGLGVLGGAGCVVTFGRWIEPCALLLSTPYFMARWGIEGAVNAVPEGERRRSRDAIARAAAEIDQARLREAVLEEGRSRKEPAPVPLAVQGLRSAGARSRYRDTATGGIDTVIEVALERVVLEVAKTDMFPEKWGPWSHSFKSEVDPSLCMIATARLRLFSVAQDAVLFEKVFTQFAGCAQFRDWAKDEAAEFRKAGDAAIEGLARWTADEVFGFKGLSMDAPPSNESKEEPR